jgi:NADH-quinone oxidoreductase subunit J
MLTGSFLLTSLVILLGGAGAYLLLPHAHGQAKARNVYIAGAVVAGLGLLGFLALLSPPEDMGDTAKMLAAFFFYTFSALALGCGMMTITSRNPVYSALWFAGVVVSTSGLFVLAGAQFLAAGTVIVYAGAIIVMFLFVIMLAQMEGKAVYDRSARSPAATTATCFLLLGAFVVCLAVPGYGPVPTYNAAEAHDRETLLVRNRGLAERLHLRPSHPLHVALDHAARPTSSIYTEANQEKPDVAGLGETLYADHLLTVELAGSLLFVALIAAVAITNPRRPVRPRDPSATPTGA